MTQRFHASEPDKFGNVHIWDMENTEPVCLIHATFHPYAPKIIEEALNKIYPDVSLEVKSILGIGIE